MRLFIFTIFVFISFGGFCQSDSLTFDKEVISESKLSKEVLFANAQTWISKTFGDYKSVVQLENKEQGRIIIKGITPLEIFFKPDFKYLIIIDVKDNKHRFYISEIMVGFGRKYSETYTDGRLLTSAISRMVKEGKTDLPSFQSISSQITDIKIKINNMILSYNIEMLKDSKF